MLDALEALARASLVRQGQGSEHIRLEMLDTVREYAAEQLELSGEGDLARWRHVAFFLDLAETAEPLLHGPQQGDWLDRLEVEQPNPRAALDWSLATALPGGSRMAAALWEFWLIRDFVAEGRGWMDAAVAAATPAPPAVRAKVLYCAGMVAAFRGCRAGSPVV